MTAPDTRSARLARLAQIDETRSLAGVVSVSDGIWLREEIDRTDAALNPETEGSEP